MLETLRRWGTWWDYPPAYLDDVFIGAFFLFAAWKSARDRHAGQRYLAAAWGVGCGTAYMSLYINAGSIDARDPSGVSGMVAVAMKGVMLMIAIAGLIGALRERPRTCPRNKRQWPRILHSCAREHGHS